MTTQTNIQIFNNWWCKYVTRVNRYSVKRDICDAICTKHLIPVHLYRFHNITDQEVISQWNNDNDSIWQHFSKKDLFSGECKFCGKLFKTGYNKATLERHLRVIHKREMAAIRKRITRSWVSPHFTFNLYNYYSNCMYCDYSVKIYDGVDVLKNHLIEVHELDENVVHRIEKELDYLETTMQCTTEESNVATSSQDGNTH